MCPHVNPKLENGRRTIMADTKMPHPGHEEHLCYLQNVGYVQSDLEEYKDLVRNPGFVCKNCGRAAHSDTNLCAPEKL
jgi:hypothetical protein